MEPKRLIVSAMAAAVFCATNAQAQWKWSPSGRSTGQPAQSAPELRLNPVVRNWGEPPPDNEGADIMLTNEEWYLSCMFAGKLSPESSVTQRELEDHERELSRRDFFERLNAFMIDYEGDFDWARLSCVNRYAAEEIAEREEREARAIEKAERARQRRRGSDDS